MSYVLLYGVAGHGRQEDEDRTVVDRTVLEMTVCSSRNVHTVPEITY